jgi:hypothetical protein
MATYPFSSEAPSLKDGEKNQVEFVKYTSIFISIWHHRPPIGSYRGDGVVTISLLIRRRLIANLMCSP